MIKFNWIIEYKGYKNIEKTEYIKKIDSVNKKVYLTNGYIYFNQIIKIN